MNGQCEGWAYEACNSVADIELTEQWADGHWTSHELCVEHLKQALDYWPAEQHPADTWRLEPL